MSAENPPTGCVAAGAGAGSVLTSPGKGAGDVASAGRIARPIRLGAGGVVAAPAADGGAATAAAVSARSAGRGRVFMSGAPHRAAPPTMLPGREHAVTVLETTIQTCIVAAHALPHLRRPAPAAVARRPRAAP